MNWNLEILPVPDPDLELRGGGKGGGVVIQTFRKGGAGQSPKKNVFRPFGLLDPPLNTFQIFRLISDTYFLSFFVSDIPYQFIRYKMFSQVSICLFYVCARVLFQLILRQLYHYLNFVKLILMLKKDGQETSCKFSLLLPVKRFQNCNVLS